MDVGEILRYSGAQGYGSPSAGRLVEVMGASQKNVHAIKTGNHLELGPFSVDVCELEHRWTPLNHWINGALRTDLEAPLKLLDYKMDASYGFRIQADNMKMLVGDLPFVADVLFTIPLKPMAHYEQLLVNVEPKLAVPIHWDDLFHPSTKQARPIFMPPKLKWPPLQRVNIDDFKCKLNKRVLVPSPFQAYELNDEVLPSRGGLSCSEE